ncbi:MAG: YibE/F family protein [Marmoricola sp.]
MPGKHAAESVVDSEDDRAHGHHHGPPPSIEVRGSARTALIAFLIVVAIAVIAGAAVLLTTKSAAHPSSPYAAPGVTFPKATVSSIAGVCPGGGCRKVAVRIDDGADAGRTEVLQVPAYVVSGGLTKGDHIRVQRNPAYGNGAASYSWWDNVDRSTTLWLLVGLFVLLVLVVARLRGLLAIVGLVLAGVVVLKMMLPALLGGQNGMAVALVGSAAIMYVVLYLAHGWSLRTSTALAGTLVGMAIVAVLGWFATDLARLSGASDDNAIALNSLIHIDLRGVALCGLILVSLGLLNDVTVTQASAVWELRAAAPAASRTELFTRGMRIGRDHIASTIYTIVFAYTGTALVLLLLAAVYSRPYGQLLSTDAVAEDVVRTLAAAIGLVLAVPVTTAIAVGVVGGAES